MIGSSERPGERRDPARDPRDPPTMASAGHEPADRPFAEGAPNVLVIVLDDLGFAHLGSYGSDIDIEDEVGTWLPRLSCR